MDFGPRFLAKVPEQMRSIWLTQWIVLGLLFAAACLSGCAQTSRQTSQPPTIAELYQRASEVAMQSEARLQMQTAASSLDPHRSVDRHDTTLLVSAQNELTVGRTRQSKAGAILVSEFFEDTDLNEALELLSRQAEVPLVVGEQVGGRTSASIEDMPFEDALRQVLLPLGYVFRYRDGAYYIGALDPESNLFHYIATEHSYRPTFLGAEELREMLPKSLQQFVRVSDKRHMVQVEAPHDVAEDILARLATYDQPVPQVVLEALVCVISPNQSTRFGMDIGQTVTEGGASLLDLGLNGLVFGGTVSPYGVRNAFSNFAQTSAFIKLLAQEGYVAIRAAPRVMARDGEKAKISIARENYFAVQPISANVNDLFIRQEIQKVESGIALELTPTILGNRITVKIDKAEVREDVQLAGASSVVGNPYPQINRRTVSTTVEVADGETIVIGGLVQKQTVDRITRVPVLSKIPLFGKMFTTIERQDEEAEIVIFISPRLVYGNVDCSNRNFQPSTNSQDIPVTPEEPKQQRQVSVQQSEPHELHEPNRNQINRRKNVSPLLTLTNDAPTPVRSSGQWRASSNVSLHR